MLAGVFLTACEEKKENLLPNVTFSAPGESDYFFPDDHIQISIDASDEDGIIKEVVLRIDGVLANTFTETPYDFIWDTPGKETGSSRLSVTVTDDDNANGYAIQDVMILDPESALESPVASYSVDKRLVKRQWTIQFTDLSENDPTSWFWDFGNGDTSTEQNPGYAYFETGTFTVSLVASNVFGADTVVQSDLITVINEDPRDICWQCDTIDTVTDVDGNVYNTVIIGPQLWMVENLKTTRLNDGTPIPVVDDNEEWDIMTGPGYCWYENDSSAYHETYGPLYNWYTVNTEKLCPDGWHVPTGDDLSTLLTSLGGQEVASGKMKEAGFEHWDEPNTGATNSSGFTALPGGFRHPYEGAGFYGAGFLGKYWLSDLMSSGSVQIMQLEHENGELHWFSYTPAGGMSVRCIKDREKIW